MISGLDAFETFCLVAAGDAPPIVAAGRYPSQIAAEELIVADVAPKLRLSSTHRLLLGLLHRCQPDGLEAWLLAQPEGLPFSNTREDVLVWRHPE
jgi:hypothetical protein